MADIIRHLVSFEMNVFNHINPSLIYCDPFGFGDGRTISNPISFEIAITSDKIISGDTILLIDGIYKGNFQINILGATDNPITIKSLHPYKAVIDGSFTIGDLSGSKGSFIIIKNIHFNNTDLNRGTWSMPEGSITRMPNINIQAPNVSIINNLIHDGGIGIAGYSLATNCLIYGNVVWNSGWADDLYGGAQNIYMHSDSKFIKHNIFSGAFKRTIQFSGSNGALTNSEIIENVAFCKESFLIGSYNVPNYGIKLIGNHILGWTELGYVFDPNDDIEVCNNIINSEDNYSGIRFSWWKNIKVNNNAFINPKYVSFDIFPPSRDYEQIESYIIDGNKYYKNADGYQETFYIRNDIGLTFSDWQKYGYDLNGSISYNMPSENKTYVYPNEYYDSGDSRLGFVVIWNWEGLDNVSVDLSILKLSRCKKYRWRNAQNPLEDNKIFRTRNSIYSFPMTNHTVAYPIGFDELLMENKFPGFGCFIIEKV